MAKKNIQSTKPRDVFVSVVVAADKESLRLDSYIKQLARLLHEHYMNYEIIVVGGGIGLQEIAAVKKILSKIPCVRFITLAREYDVDTAIFAGLDAAIGDYVCTLDETIDPIEMIPQFIAQNSQTDIVQGVSAVPVKGVVGSNSGRRLFYWYNRKYMHIHIAVNATYFMSFTRKVVNVMTRSSRDHRRIRHLANVVGFEISPLRYVPLTNPQNSRSLRGGIMEALETITGYSTHPLRVVSWLGVFAGLLNLLYAVYIVVINVVDSPIARGWTTTSLQLSGMFFILFLAVAVMAEYMGRILSEQRNEQKYIIDDEFTSTISIADFERKNITSR